MAETDISHEFGGEPGFSCSVFGPECSHMLHMEVLLRCQLNAQSWKDTKLSKLSKICPNFKIRVSFGLWG